MFISGTLLMCSERIFENPDIKFKFYSKLARDDEKGYILPLIANGSLQSLNSYFDSV